MNDDPFVTLGLTDAASADEVRAARRQLAKEHHPDTGGNADRMRALNQATARALQMLAAPPDRPVEPAADRAADRAPEPADHEWTGVTSDVSSFTVEALPAVTFEALLVVTSWLGDVLDDDPPYRLDTHLREPIPCWCRLELVPEAGGSTVGITIATVDDTAPPPIDAVRDLWVDNLNRLDWSEVEAPTPW